MSKQVQILIGCTVLLVATGLALPPYVMAQILQLEQADRPIFF